MTNDVKVLKFSKGCWSTSGACIISFETGRQKTRQDTTEDDDHDDSYSVQKLHSKVYCGRVVGQRALFFSSVCPSLLVREMT